MQKPILLFCALALAAASFAGGTRLWEHSSQAEFEKGALKNLSLRSDGRLRLAPELREWFDSSTAYLWSAAEDSRGRVYAGGGGPESANAKLFLVEGAGKGRLLAELPGLDIYAIAIDARDRVYAATSPDGKVYRIDGDAKPEVFYDPRAKYIWALAFNNKGDLFVATGDKGEIHRVAPDGTGAVFFRTEETHARSLATDKQGNLYAGTEPGGLVLRITPAGEGFVLYQSAKREITALLALPDGSVYAAAVGNKQPAAPVAPAPAAPPPQPVAQPVGAVPGAPQPQAPTQRPTVPAPVPIPSLGATITGGSEVIRIEADGYPRKLWSHLSEIAYSLALDAGGRPLIGTGNKGNIYRLDTDLLSTLLLNATPTQITGLASGRGGRVFAVTGNIGKLYQLGPGIEKEGAYESEVLDASFFTYWGRLHFHGERSGGRISVQARSGNLDLPQRNWSGWSEVPLASDGGRVAAPPARFLQYRLSLTASADGRSPEVSAVEIAYQPKNVAPVIEIIAVTPPNYRFPPQTLTLTPSQSLTLPPLARPSGPKSAAPTLSTDTGAVSLNYAKGHIGARWLARDENGDLLHSKVEMRGAGESGWMLLKENVKEKYLSWDSSAFPDGDYRVRVTVTDSPANPPRDALTAQLESDPFLIDNTPPAIQGLAATRAGSRIEVRWRAKDALNVISKAEYSVDGGEWLVVEPTTKLSDSPEHDYVLALDNLDPGEHTIAVRVTDGYDNQAVEKTVVR